MKILAVLQSKTPKIFKKKHHHPIWKEQVWNYGNQLNTNFCKQMRIKKRNVRGGYKKPGTILLAILISWYVSKDENCHTFCKLFSLILQKGRHHQPLNVQTQRQKDHALHSGQSITLSA
jgi:hypothetical protein